MLESILTLLSPITPLDLVWACLETLYMAFLSTLFAYLLGLPLGVLLAVTERGGLLPAPRLYAALSFIVNMLRSVPFLILLITVLPLTRLITGTTIGATATVVPLAIAATPMIGQVVRSALIDVDPGVIEAARAHGATPMQLIAHVLLPEARPALLTDAAISATTIIGYSAMAGFVGGGGLGNLAIQQGYYRYNNTLLIISVILLVIIVQLTGLAGTRAARALDRRKNQTAKEN